MVLALLESPGADPYATWFEENVEVLEELRKDGKPSVASKARQVLEALGYEIEREQRPTPTRRQVSSGRASSQNAGSPPPRQHQQNEVDFLGFDGLSIHETPAPAAPPAPVQAAPPAEFNIFGSPQTGPAQAPPPPAPIPAQEVSVRSSQLVIRSGWMGRRTHLRAVWSFVQLLDGFDPLGSSAPSSHSLAASQQQYQQQPQQYPPEAAGMYQEQAPPVDPRTQSLSHFGKDLFTIANSPRGAAPAAVHEDGSGTPGAGQSAFNFM